MEIEIQKIGRLNESHGSTDEYVLMTRKDDDLTPDQAHDYLLPLVYREGRGAGSYFCHRVTILEKPYSTNEVVAIIHHSYDV